MLHLTIRQQPADGRCPLGETRRDETVLHAGRGLVASAASSHAQCRPPRASSHARGTRPHGQRGLLPGAALSPVRPRHRQGRVSRTQGKTILRAGRNHASRGTGPCGRQSLVPSMALSPTWDETSLLAGQGLVAGMASCHAWRRPPRGLVPRADSSPAQPRPPHRKRLFSAWDEASWQVWPSPLRGLVPWMGQDRPP